MNSVLIVDDSRIDRALVKSILLGDDSLHVAFAENGAAAMDYIAKSEPDVVVTDLIMPEMDGLQVVMQVRDGFTHIPVILMTSQGTEETAIEALQAGAASFVPKSRLVDRLTHTIHQVLDLKQRSHPFQHVVSRLSKAEIEFLLENDIGLIPTFVELIQKSLSSLSFCDATESIRLSLAVEEALLNALVHGNLELTREVAAEGIQPSAEYFTNRLEAQPYKDRKINVCVRIAHQRVTFVVRDEGPGFDLSSLPDASDLAPFQDGVGRGLKLMRSFMDEVVYSEPGNELTLTRHFSLRTSTPASPGCGVVS